MSEYEIQPVRFGMGGLDLRRAPDIVRPEDALILTNVIHTPDGAWQARKGMTSYATAGSGVSHHSVRRLEDPIGGTVTRIWGAGQSLYRGASGALTSVESGFSGDPLSMVPWHPPQSGESWMVIGDRLKMRKIRASDGLILPLGLPVATPPTVTVDPAETLVVNSCNSGFTGAAGTGGFPSVTHPAGVSVAVVTNAGAAPADYYNLAFFDYLGTFDLSSFGSILVEDEDFMHLKMSCGGVVNIMTEVRIYLVLESGAIDFATLPGTSASINTNYYVHSFEVQTVPGLNSGGIVTFGETGITLRRSDFVRGGSDSSVDWANVRTMCISVHCSTNTNGAIAIVDEIQLVGGYDPDVTADEALPYTYKVTNFDSRTGAEGNGSSASSEVSPTRQQVSVDPIAYGDAAIRQRVYRKGGLANDDWHYVGVNTSDGGVFLDTLSDNEVSVGESAPTDHFQPVPSVNTDGSARLGQPAPYIWGPLNGIVFAAGDIYRPGVVYFCKPDQVDHWGASDYCDVCGPTEKVINGFVLGNQPFAWSSQKLYFLNVVTDSGVATVTSSAAGCTRAPAGPWAFTVGNGLVAFCASDGIWVTNGGPEEPLSEDWVRPLFRGEEANGYAPIDFSQSGALRMEIHQNELWFFYVDTDSNHRILLYNFFDKKWRMYQFGKQTEMGYSENVPGVTQLILGGHNTNTSYLHAGIGDAGVAVDCNIRTGALNQGNPRSDKLYGDILFDMDRQDTTIAIVPYINHQAEALRQLNVRTDEGRKLYRYNFFEPPVRAINLAIDISWSSAIAQPLIYLAYLSYIHCPEQVQARPLDWDLGGNLSTKTLKGIVMEVDTLGVHKLLNIELDGTVVTQIDIVANGRRVIERSWAAAEGHEIRLVPADEVPYELYGHQWIFDLEPYTLARWETDQTNHGFPGWQMPTGGFITLLSNASVSLQVTGYNQLGTGITKTYTITTTGGVKQQRFVPFEATKGVLYKYVLTSTAPFRLYREESHIMVQPWAAGEAQPIHVFGNDDLDPSRGMGIASLQAATPGGQAQ